MTHQPNTNTSPPDPEVLPDTDIEVLMDDDPEARVLLAAFAGLSTPVQVLYLRRSDRDPRSRDLFNLGQW
jgi:hypothetical protein